MKRTLLSLFYSVCLLIACTPVPAQVVIGGGVVGAPPPELVVGPPAPAIVVGPPPAVAVAPPPADTPQVIGTGLKVSKTAGVKDGQAGGLTVMRNTTGLKGGERGYVNAASYTYSLTGRDVVSFEWANLTQLDNHSTAGENVAVYAQANKYGTGPTWALVNEVWSNTTDPGAIVAQELDIWVTGFDTGNRIGLDIVLGDSGTTHGGTIPSGVVQASSAIRIGTHLPSWRWTRGLQLTGSYVVGIDTSTAAAQTAVRLGAGQSMSFENTDQIRVKFENGKIRFMNGALAIYEIDMNTGDTFKRGVKAP